jgi:hypothetical protein
MNPKTFRAFWAIQRQAEYTDPTSLPRGGIDYEDILYIYRSDIIEDPAVINTGEYIAWIIDAPSTDPFPTANGPIGVDTYTGGLSAYLDDLRDRIALVIETQLGYRDPPINPATYEGVILMDLEDWSPYWRRVYGVWGDDPDPDARIDRFVPAQSLERRYTVEAHWRQHVRDNHPGYLSGLTTDAEIEAKFEETYLDIARPVHDAIFESVRAMCPNAMVSDYGWPLNAIYDINPNHEYPAVYEDFIRANNTFIPRMARNWDYLAPDLYPALRALPIGATVGDDYIEALRGDWTKMYSRLCKEYRRIQARCHGMPIYCHVGPFYGVGEAHPLFDVTLDPLTARLQVQMCRLFGFDGIIMWGYVDLDTHMAGREAQYNAALAIMQPRIKAYLESCQGIYCSTNSPISIGDL